MQNEQNNLNLDFDFISGFDLDFCSIDLLTDHPPELFNVSEGCKFNPEMLINDQFQSMDTFYPIDYCISDTSLLPFQSQIRHRKRRGDGEESQKRDPDDKFTFKNKPCYSFISMVSANVYRKKPTSQILTTIANTVELLNPKIPQRSRMAKRRKAVCYAWFHKHWNQISKMKKQIIEHLENL